MPVGKLALALALALPTRAVTAAAGVRVPLRLHTKPIQTLLAIKHRTDDDCFLDDFRPTEIPTLLLDDSSRMYVKKLYNSQALALLCVSEIGDVLSLSTLAQNLDLMRHSRIVVLLHSPDSNLGEFLRIISEQATSKQFVNLVVLHSSSSESRDSSTLYRMHPYPSPTFTRVTNFSDERIFLNFWTDFQRKPAVILHELRTPASFISVDRRTGKKELQGSSNTFLKEFAEKHNIQLQLLNPFSELGIAKTMEILTMAREVVPCSQEMSVRHVYLGLRSYFIIILCSYILFEVIETLIIYATNWIYQRRANISYSRFVLNLRAFAGILGLPMPRRRYRTSISLQQIIMLMCFCGLIFTAFFNANLSTLLTKHPYNKEIRNFDELRDSGLEVLLDENFKIGLEPKFSGSFKLRIGQVLGFHGYAKIDGDDATISRSQIFGKQ
ncbi:uncharacterized protein LOC26528148 [Drosophila mojavensis]|uniref:uncharacterized protein LOC26528148 n=1 Tax=Drosophila mojavensis TaxID=7230 RepID=UPI0013EE6F6B|nr:uncharacterized protein LOC26528148 [Drosophila mojavensis]